MLACTFAYLLALSSLILFKTHCLGNGAVHSGLGLLYHLPVFPTDVPIGQPYLDNFLLRLGS